MGIVATIVVPNLRTQMPSAVRKQAFAQIGSLARLSWQQALVTQKAFRLFFILEKRMIRVEQETAARDKDGIPKFKEFSIPYLASTYEWPENIVIKQFFIGNQDMMARQGIKTQEVWFYIAADGIVQPVIINLINTHELDGEGKPLGFSLVMNPFTGQFKEYEEFQKP